MPLLILHCRTRLFLAFIQQRAILGGAPTLRLQGQPMNFTLISHHAFQYYFLIEVDKKKKILQVGYCKFTRLGNSPINDMVAVIKGKTAIEIVNTLIREKFISSLQHAADMGIELHKAELSLRYGFKYIQDKDLFIDK